MTSILRFDGAGLIDCLYTEAIDLRALGRLQVFRATDIRFCDGTQLWEVRCATTAEILHTDPSREACLAWERDNLQPKAKAETLKTEIGGGRKCAPLRLPPSLPLITDHRSLGTSATHITTNHEPTTPKT